MFTCELLFSQLLTQVQFLHFSSSEILIFENLILPFIKNAQILLRLLRYFPHTRLGN